MRCTRRLPPRCSKSAMRGRWWRVPSNRPAAMRPARCRCPASHARISDSNRRLRKSGSRRPAFLFGQLPHIRFELVVLVLHRIEEQTLQQVGLPIGFVHLLDEMRDLPYQIFERAFQLAFRGYLAVQRFHDGQQIAIERNLGAGCRFDRAHDQAPKLLIADASSAWISRKFCAPVIESMVSTRFCTPESFSFPPAALAWR